MGVSRVTDITRLDRLGLPVYAGVRPRGRTLRVHAGKGLEADEARIGALMESIELAWAERDSVMAPDATATWAELSRDWPKWMQLSHLAPQQGVRVDAAVPWPAVRCECLWSGSDDEHSLLMPAELVRLPQARGTGTGLFPWSSNGLASGSSLAEATLHALLELLERDTRALHGARDRSRRLMRMPATFETMATIWSAMGVHLLVRELPNEFGLACFAAYLHEPSSPEVNLAGGAGLHPDRGIALARAVSEAAQSRLSNLHGARDDITAFFDKYRMDSAARQAAEARLLALLTCEDRSVNFDEVPHQRWLSPARALSEVRGRLAAQGMPLVVRHRVAGPGVPQAEFPMHVVKLVVPGLEMLEPHNRRVGHRLLSRLLAPSETLAGG